MNTNQLRSCLNVAEAFRKSKIEKYYTALRVRKAVLNQQIKNHRPITSDKELDEKLLIRQQGQLDALELILKELEHEFDLYNPDNPESNISKLADE
jgi:hypothetical protein